ncbi:MAG: hypothetical protein OEV42_18665 [Deltaproteobacteria bacterium]|nr:hypothetical protein [Deltaproteobacteria bacterium]
MKRKVAVYILTLFFVSSCLTTNAMAVGLGFNLSGGGGSTEWDIEQQSWPYAKWKEDTDDSIGGIGFVLDTAVAKNRLFNYRLNIGLHSADYEYDSGATFETSGWFMTHDFGFAFIRNNKVRLWAGPEIRLSYSQGELDTDNDYEIDIVTFGIGPVIGANFNFAKNMTLTVKTGVLGTSSAGVIEHKTLGFVDQDIDGSGSYSFINVGLTFRLGDEYKK